MGASSESGQSRDQQRREQPPPGSDAALALGCRCAVLENAHGCGIPHPAGPLYWMTADCPLHGEGERHEVREDNGEAN
jgi:hypothetical protein